MNKARVTKLIETLRFGDYKQGYGALHKKINGQNYYCCLGVACEIYRKETGRGTWADLKWGDILCFEIENDSSVSELPDCIQNWYGFSSPFVDFGSGLCAPVCNDALKEDFNRIADRFENLITQK
jgi:hypothetical protein